MRIDKFLWCVRLFKTRAKAAEAVTREQVQMGGRVVKASAEVRVGDLIALREPPIWRSWCVRALPPSRVGARLVPNMIEERTALDDLKALEQARQAKRLDRDPGIGRPTKRERRDMDRFRSE